MGARVSFLGVQFKSKHLNENEKKLSFCKNFLPKTLIFENFLNGQSPYGLKHIIITLPHIFQYIPFVVQLLFSSSKTLPDALKALI